MIESGEALRTIECALGKIPVEDLIARRRQEIRAVRSQAAKIGHAIRRQKAEEGK